MNLLGIIGKLNVDGEPLQPLSLQQAVDACIRMLQTSTSFWVVIFLGVVLVV